MKNMKRVYDLSFDKQGRAILSHVGDFATWRETHAVRRLTRERRKEATTVVYDAGGNFICTP